jgi:uncharacterized protein YcnI
MSRVLVPRLVTVAGVAGLAVWLAAGPASAHVSADAPGAAQGGFAVISFRVPTESETASTVGLKVQFPADQPLAFVSVKPHAGWTYKVTTAKLATPIKTDEGQDVTAAVSVIEWRAASGAAGVKPGEYDDFQVSAGPLPKVDSMTFKAIQAYSDGSEVAWVEEPAPGSSTEPEHPAPTIPLAPADGGAGAGAERPGQPAGSGPGGGSAPAPSATASVSPAAAATDSGTASGGSVVGAYVLAALGLAAGVAGLALGVAARRRSATVDGSGSVRTGVE